MKDLNQKINQERKRAKGGSEMPDAIVPIHIFPKTIQDFVLAYNKDLRLSKDFLLGSILAASSVAIGNTKRAYFSRDKIASASLFLVIVGRAGANKSQPISIALKPIRRMEHDLEDEKQYVISDYTQEALAAVLEKNKRGIIIVRDELIGLINDFGRYNKGSGEQDLLTSFSGQSLKINRKTGKPIKINVPFISITGSIQPDLLPDLAKGRRRANGFLDRFLFIFPTNVKKEYWTDNDVAPEFEVQYRSVIEKLLNLSYFEDENSDSEYVFFAHAAKQLILNWQKQNTDLSNKSNDRMASIYSKLEIYILRFALILQSLYWACDETEDFEISERAAKGAIELVEYFRITAQNVAYIIDNTTLLDTLDSNKRKLYDALPSEFPKDIGLTFSKAVMSDRNFANFLNSGIEMGIFEKKCHGVYKKTY
jgi:hypothetical protein